MSAAITAKAQRLLAAGAVLQDPCPAQVFRVDGDHGKYTVVVGAHIQQCSCPARGTCAHIQAAVKLTLSEGSERARYDEALRERRARDHAEAEKLFDRLGA